MLKWSLRLSFIVDEIHNFPVAQHLCWKFDPQLVSYEPSESAHFTVVSVVITTRVMRCQIERESVTLEIFDNIFAESDTQLEGWPPQIRKKSNDVKIFTVKLYRHIHFLAMCSLSQLDE